MKTMIKVDETNIPTSAIELNNYIESITNIWIDKAEIRQDLDLMESISYDLMYVSHAIRMIHIKVSRNAKHDLTLITNPEDRDKTNKSEVISDITKNNKAMFFYFLVTFLGIFLAIIYYSFFTR